MAATGTARPGRGGYTPRNKQPKPKLGTVKPGKPSAGRALGFGKPGGFQKLKPAAAKPGLDGAAAPAPKPVVGQHAQPDSLYNEQVATAEAKGESQLSHLGDQERAVRFDFGIDDPTNPFSRVNGLKQAFLARRKAASVNLASQGQLYSGAHERALSRTRQEEEQARAQLRQAFDAAIGQIGAEKAGVKFTTEEERAQAFEDWLARAPEADVALTDEENAAADQAGAAAADEPGAPSKGLTAAQRDQLAPPGPPKGVPAAGSGLTGAEAARGERARQRRAQAFQRRADAARERLQAAREAERREGAARVQEARGGGGGRHGGRNNRPQARPRPRPQARPHGRGGGGGRRGGRH